MELFVVNRYLENIGPDQDSSEKALRRLHRLARRRRREACAAEQKTEEPDAGTGSVRIAPSGESTDVEKKRKLKIEKASSAVLSTDEGIQESLLKKVRKGSRFEGVDEVDPCVEVSTDSRLPLPAKRRKGEPRTDQESEQDDAGQVQNGSPAKLDGVSQPGENGCTPKKKRKRSRKRKSKTGSNDPSAPAEVKKRLENGETVGGYTIIGEVENKNPQKVKRILPDWLAKPTVVSVDLGGQLTPVDGVAGLNEHLVRRLQQTGITHFFPVQSNVIPWLLKSVARNWIRQPDLCVSSPTGSGKTLAFVLPVVQALMSRVVCSIKALVVLPVRDLAVQVYKVFATYSAGTQLQIGLAVGERILSDERVSLVKDGKSLVDILVCTPGRLVNHISETPGFSLEDLRFLIIDEADRMMQFIKQDWLNEVEKFVQNSRGQTANSVFTVDRMANLRRMPQKLLFSATLSNDPEKLEDVKLFQPKLFTSIISAGDCKIFNASGQDEPTGEFVGKYTTPKELSEAYVECENFLKPLIVLHFIHNVGYRHLLCFTNTVESSHRLSLLLSLYGGVEVREYNSKLSVHARDKIMNGFHKGSVDVIVCSDAMTRGMDVKDVDYVISYDLPPYLKTYIHRVGRTARAGRTGTAITLVTRKEITFFRKMMLTRNMTIQLMSVDTNLLESMEDQYKSVLERMKVKITEGKSKV